MGSQAFSQKGVQGNHSKNFFKNSPVVFFDFVGDMPLDLLRLFLLTFHIFTFNFSTVKPGSLLIDTSTIEPSVAREVGEIVQSKGATFLDAPVSGGTN